LGDISDEEDGESLERKFARLRREIEEVKEEFTRRDFEKRNGTGRQEPVGDEVTEEDAAVLSKMLDRGCYLYNHVRTGFPAKPCVGHSCGF
jgi:nuclear migration protein JNM1